MKNIDTDNNKITTCQRVNKFLMKINTSFGFDNFKTG